MATQEDNDNVPVCPEKTRTNTPRSPVQQRLHDGYRLDRRYQAQVVSDLHDARAARIEAVLELKQSVDASFAKIKEQHKATKARNEATRVQQAHRYQDLIDQGKNPYEIARREAMERETQLERFKMEQCCQEREMEQIERLQAEERRERKQHAIEASRRAYEKKYQQEMSQAARNERTSAYVMAQTGKELLDATGKCIRVYPSQETTMIETSFGLGKSAVLSREHRHRVIEKVRRAKSLDAEIQPISMMLPRRQKRFFSKRESCKLPPLLTETGPWQPHHVRLKDDEKQSMEETASTRERKIVRDPSVLEEQQLAKARQLQHDMRFKPFTGKTTFIATPSVLWFKDFDVARPLSLAFTLTNVSNTFNQFRLLPLDETVLELFTIEYEKPGRMAAGRTCCLFMTFTATEAWDLETTLSIAAPTGIIQLPVRCTCKKAVPFLNEREVRFPDTVVGEHVTVALQLVNDGALPLEFVVRSGVSSSVDPVQRFFPFVDACSESSEREETAASEEEECMRGMNADSGHVDVDLAGQENEEAQVNEQAPDITHKLNDEEEEEEEERESHEEAAAAASSVSSSRSACDHQAALANGNFDDESTDAMTSDEIELVERVQETLRFNPERADEPVRFTRRGIVAPYSKASISFTFAPATAMKLVDEPFHIAFPAASALPRTSVSDTKQAIPLRVSGLALPPPVSLTPVRLHFSCCAYGKLYRHQVVVSNRGNVALKVHARVPKPFADYVAFHPRQGFVQAAVASSEKGKLVIHVTFRPQERMWTSIERAGFGSRKLGMLALPIQVMSVPDQLVPVFFVLVARLTSVLLDVQTGHLDGTVHFGTCCVGHSVRHNVVISNSARVPQRVSIRSLPPEIRVLGEESGDVLLPGETRTYQLVYTPHWPGSLSGSSVTIWSSTLNQAYTVPCVGTGVPSELVFSSSAVRLGATSLGQTQVCSVTLTNASTSQSRLVELRLPSEANAFLQITPLVSRLAPRESVRLEIVFNPTEEIFNLTKTCFVEANETEKLPENEVELRRDVPEAPDTCQEDESVHAMLEQSMPPPHTTAIRRSCHHTWTILCFQQHDEDAKTKPVPKLYDQFSMQALEIRTTVIDATFTLSTRTLDFGQVAIGQKSVRQVEVDASRTADRVQLRAQPLDVFGPFRVVGALRELTEARKQTIRVEFQPQRASLYEDELDLRDRGGNVRVRLCGEGIQPRLSIDPLDGKVDFGHVLARSRHVRELVLTNDSAFPLPVSIQEMTRRKEDDDDDDDGSLTFDAAAPRTTSMGLPFFFLSPSSAIIPAHGTLSIQVVFQPDRQSHGPYFQRFRIEGPATSQQDEICVVGRCWETKLYLFSPYEETTTLSVDDASDGMESKRREGLPLVNPVDDVFDLPPGLASVSQIPLLNACSAELWQRTTSSFTLTFMEHRDNPSCRSHAGDEPVGSSNRSISKTIYVGSIVALDDASSGPSAGSFDLVMDENSLDTKLFTIEPARGIIAAGQQVAIVVTFTPPAQTARPEFQVIQWVQVRVQCTLKETAVRRPLSKEGGGTKRVAATIPRSEPSSSEPASFGDGVTLVTVILRTQLET